MKEFSDKEIVECLRTRQSYMVRYLSDRYLPMIRLMVTRMGGAAEDAKDIFQDGLVIMLEKIDTYQLVLTCKFKSFFYSVCENLWKKVLEERRATANSFNRGIDALSVHDFTKIYDNQLYQNMLHEVLETLDPEGKEILKLYWQEFSLTEIAKKLGYTYGYVKKKKYECQAELMRRVTNHPSYKQIKKTEELIVQVMCN